VTTSPAAGSPLPGLSWTEARALLRAEGPNQLRQAPPTARWRLFARQLTGTMPALLAAAAAIAMAVGDRGDAIAIVAILVLDAVVGFAQEHRAERAILSLRAMTAPRARVVRDGRTTVVPAIEIVRGDLLSLEAGDVVAADATLVAAHALAVTEAALTGESMPVDKRVGPSPPGTPLAERTGEVLQGTVVTAGVGLGVVTAIGMQTELGAIAGMLAHEERQSTPLEQRLTQLGRWLVIGSSIVVAIVAALGLTQGRTVTDVLLTAVSLGVAAVPEGLTAIITIALAVGVQRMAARHVLVRRLHAVETLGCTTVICTDKTGTLTTGVMAVRELWGDDHERLLGVAAACCEAELGATPGTGTGDPTELAILEAARVRGIERDALEREAPRVAVHPFDTDRRRMSIARADGVLYVKGAIDAVVPLARGEVGPILAASAALAARGLRVLAVATGTADDERDLDLVGLIGLADPPRPEAIEAIAAARAAGIRTVMITGDHPATARAIAVELGLLGDADDPAEVVHARATPRDKLEIVRTLKDGGEIVAMTGDGANDAPALRAAHVGIAMGRTGTEVTREAAAMVLADDNFASIVAAIREGRAIYENIRKTLVYLLGGNAGEILVMLGAVVVGFPVPLLPLQLLWINLVTDGLPALALVVDPPAIDTLGRPPRPPDEPLLGRREWLTVGLAGALDATVVLATFGWALEQAGVTHARTMAFSVLVFAELFRSFAARSSTRIFWEVEPFANLKLVGVIAVSVVLQIAVHEVEVTRQLFEVEAMTPSDWATALAIGLVPVTVVELVKLARRAARRFAPHVTTRA